MQADWTKTSLALPPEGTPVEFLLDERDCPMRGVYAIGRFESRWNNYAPTSVHRWREVATGSAPSRALASPGMNMPLHTRRNPDARGGFLGLAIGAA